MSNGNTLAQRTRYCKGCAHPFILDDLVNGYCAECERRRQEDVDLDEPEERTK